MGKEYKLHRYELLGAVILEIGVVMGGNVSGEHGVVVEKLNSMYVQFTAALKKQNVRRLPIEPKWHNFVRPDNRNAQFLHECLARARAWDAAVPRIILETAVGCARVCRERRAWQGETKQRTEVANEEQRSQDRRARCNRVHSAVT